MKIAVILLIMCVIVMLAAMQQHGGRPQSPARHHAAGVPARHFHMPPAFNSEYVDRAAVIMRLSTEQRHAVDTYFANYQRQQEALDSEELPRLQDRAVAVAAAVRSQGQDILFAERNRVATIRFAIDNVFFTGVASILAVEQLAWLKRVRDIRDHQAARVFRSRVPGSNEDLSLMVHEICKADESAIVDPIRLEEMLTEYDAAAAVLWKAYQQRSLDAISIAYELFGPAMDPHDAATNTRSLERMQEFNAWTYRLEERLRLLNMSFANSVQPVLSEAAARLLRLQYFSSAFPEVYPDPHDVSGLLACLQSEHAENTEVAAGLAAIRADYHQKHAAISMRMIDRHLEWCAWHRVQGLQDQAAFDAYKDSMIAMQAERAAAANAVLALALEASGSLKHPCSVLVAEYREATAAHEAVVTGFHVQP